MWEKSGHWWVLGCGTLVLLGLLAFAAAVSAFHPSLEKDRGASCFSNMKSLALATLTYAQDWGDRLPSAPRVPLGRSLAEGKVLTGPPDLPQYFPADDWHRRINYRNNQVFVCPSTRSIYSYEFNARVYGLHVPAMADRPSDVGVAEPARTVMEYEAGFVTGTPRGPHNNGYNVTFCDSHAKWLRQYGTPGQTATLGGGSAH